MIHVDGAVRKNVTPVRYGFDMRNTEPSPGSTAITVDGDSVSISGLVVTDPALADAIRRSEEPEAFVRRVLEVGFRGVMSMGVDIGLAEVEERMLRASAETTTAAQRQVSQMLEEAREAVDDILDPGSSGSVTAQTLTAFSEWRTDFLERFDPDRSTSHTGRLIQSMTELLGPGGALEDRLQAALDPSAPGSGLATVTELIDRRFGELRETLAAETARSEEAEKGTRKGFEFEDDLDHALRTCARHMGGTVERTSADAGDLDRAIGDYVVELESGTRIVIEAKNKKSLSLRGDGGILNELDLAMANRGARVAICVSKLSDAFPREVGPINVFGNRILVCDDGEGTLLWVAMRWALQLAEATSSEAAALDPDRIRHGLDRLLQLAERFKTSRKQLTSIKDTAVLVHESLGDMRSELLDAADDLAREAFGSKPANNVIDLSAAG